MKQHGGIALADDTLDRIIRQQELLQLIPYSPMHVYRLEKAGRFPARIHLGPARVGWSLLEVQDWIERRKAERALVRLMP